MIGAHNVLYLNAATFMVSALCLMPIRLDETLRARVRRLADRATILQDLLVGFRFVFVQHRTVLLLMLTATLYSWARAPSCSCYLCSQRNFSMRVPSNSGGCGHRSG